MRDSVFCPEGLWFATPSKKLQSRAGSVNVSETYGRNSGVLVGLFSEWTWQSHSGRGTAEHLKAWMSCQRHAYFSYEVSS